MANLNIEIKAKSVDNDKIRDLLRSNNADFKGIDHQIDTYFKVHVGRLKLKQLIRKGRSDKPGCWNNVNIT